jgi:hypothetical protein
MPVEESLIPLFADELRGTGVINRRIELKSKIQTITKFPAKLKKPKIQMNAGTYTLTDFLLT